MIDLKVDDSRFHLHLLLEQACDRCNEGESVAMHFVQICIEEASKGYELLEKKCQDKKQH